MGALSGTPCKTLICSILCGDRRRRRSKHLCRRCHRLLKINLSQIWRMRVRPHNVKHMICSSIMYTVTQYFALGMCFCVWRGHCLFYGHQKVEKKSVDLHRILISPMRSADADVLYCHNMLSWWEAHGDVVCLCGRHT